MEMMKFAMQIALLLLATGCVSNKEDILGQPATTTEAVLMEGRTESEAWTDFVDAEGSAASTYLPTVRKGLAELAPRTTYLQNDRRVVYFYPRLTREGNLEPAYAIEYPTYREVHVKRP